MGERAHPDARQGVWGAPALDGIVREVVAVLELLGVNRPHGTIWNWRHTLSEAQSEPTTTQPSRVAVDENQIEVDGEQKWLYAAIDTESKLLLEIDVFSGRGTDPAAAFLHRLTEKHELGDTEFLVDAGGYPTALARHELSGQLNYSDRNHVEKAVSDFLNANRPLSLVLPGQSGQRTPLAQTLQTPLQPRSTEPSTVWPHTSRGSTELDRAHKYKLTMKNDTSTYREREGMSQGELATAVGVSRQTINAVERNRYDPSLELAFKLAAYFDCRVEELFEANIDSVGE